ncbi:esterase E4-like [Schistocerca nitens]|uniref:esterase E4-like n=1 Tax=Schistocerca nitens TaxID=7011 RepID=UPI0021178939|nr:esterase E4-like [Schistocerca nitens]XP_049800944.1 esterase E4-like [Schistocerca nitens]
MKGKVTALVAVVTCAVWLAAAGVCGAPSTSASEEFPEVQTPLGRLRGSVLRSLDGRTIYSFRGVRYAQPPVGALRFKPPVPLNPWDGVTDATKDGARCPEAENTNQTSEDCLFLNVYTTKLPDDTRNPKRPVMVFLHPGAFYLFRGTSDLFGPQYLLDEDIVLVTLNYRLGALGFLSTGDSVLPGNNGFKDQVMALRWVQQNIASFGGDPDNVALSGYSAGSTSVYLHMLSPMSKGLFHKGIAMSAGFQSSAVKEPLQQAKKQARILNCPDTTSEKIVECLKGKDALEIAETQPQFFEFGWDPMIIFGVVIEQDFGDGAERFITADPTEQLLSGNFAQVPLIAGTTKDEFTWKGLEITYNNLAENMSENYETVFPIAFVYERGTPHSLEVSRELRKFYLQDKPITNDSEIALGQAYSDALIIFPTDRAAKIVAQLSSAPVYYYHFTYAGRYSWLYSPGTQTPYGVSHHDDLIYLFYISARFPEFIKTDPEYTTLKRMTKMWTNFIKIGNPTPEKTDVINVEWKTLNLSKPAYLEIGSELQMRQGLYYQERMRLWDRLFPLPISASGANRRRFRPVRNHHSRHAHHH